MSSVSLLTCDRINIEVGTRIVRKSSTQTVVLFSRSYSGFTPPPDIKFVYPYLALDLQMLC